MEIENKRIELKVKKWPHLLNKLTFIGPNPPTSLRVWSYFAS